VAFDLRRSPSTFIGWRDARQCCHVLTPYRARLRALFFVTGDGSKFEAHVVSDNFDGLSTIKRHKLVYAALDEHIKSGAIHALSIKAYTPAEAEQQS